MNTGNRAGVAGSECGNGAPRTGRKNLSSVAADWLDGLALRWLGRRRLTSHVGRCEEWCGHGAVGWMTLDGELHRGCPPINAANWTAVYVRDDEWCVGRSR